MVYTPDSKSGDRKAVRVQIPLAPLDRSSTVEQATYNRSIQVRVLAIQRICSSTVEQSAVNRLVACSNRARSAHGCPSG